MIYKDKFKKFGGDYIPDIIEYIKEYIKQHPNVTISVGCDSIQKRRKTIYAITIMMYNTDIHNGAHVVFFRESHDKIINNDVRLYKEAEYLHNIGTFLDKELTPFYKRKDLTDMERKRYRYHLDKCNGLYPNISGHYEETFVNNLVLLPEDKIDFKLVDLHVDFNPFAETPHKRGFTRNKSNAAYKSYVPWLRSMQFRVMAKSIAFASSTAADLLLQD